jgi:hypothetical protein
MSRAALREVEPNTARSAQSLIRQIVKPAQQQESHALHEHTRPLATARHVAAAADITHISARLSGRSSSFVQHAGSTHETQSEHFSVVEGSSSTEASRRGTRTAAAARYVLRSEHESTAYRDMANRTRSMQAAGRRAASGAGSAVLASHVNWHNLVCSGPI